MRCVKLTPSIGLPGFEWRTHGHHDNRRFFGSFNAPALQAGALNFAFCFWIRLDEARHGGAVIEGKPGAGRWSQW